MNGFEIETKYFTSTTVFVTILHNNHTKMIFLTIITSVVIRRNL